MKKSVIAHAFSASLLLVLLTAFARIGTAQQASATVTLPAAPTATPSSVVKTDSNVSPSDERYRLGAGDVLDIRVLNRPQLSREDVRVDARGFIRMPMIDGEMQAACLTEGELAEEINTRYLKYLRDPQVDVFIKSFQSQPVAVIGAVSKPGQFQLQRRVRLLELISFAGGPTERAGGRIQVARTAALATCRMVTTDGDVASGGDEDVAKRLLSFNLTDTLKGDDRANPFMQPGDIITLPEAEQAYVVGNVLRPTAIALKEPITLTRAIAIAGGTMPDTKSKQIRIVRQLPGGTDKTELVADLQAINKHQAADIILLPNDIIEVPVASGKRLFRSIFGSIVPAVSQLPVQVIR